MRFSNDAQMCTVCILKMEKSVHNIEITRVMFVNIEEGTITSDF